MTRTTRRADLVLAEEIEKGKCLACLLDEFLEETG